MSTVVLFLSGHFTSAVMAPDLGLREPAQNLENSAMMQSLQNSKVDGANSYLFLNWL